MPKSATLSGIKSLRAYTIPEAAGITGVSDRTVRAWIKKGLSAMVDERPILIRGDALIEFIRGQRTSRKKHVPEDAFYCLKCRSARSPSGGRVDYDIKGKRAKLIGICETCETIMYKAVTLGQLPEIEKYFDVTLADIADNDKVPEAEKVA